MLILFSVGLAVFQVLPLIFALSVAGRWLNEGIICNRRW
jgi:hypothetical protein